MTVVDADAIVDVADRLFEAITNSDVAMVQQLWNDDVVVWKVADRDRDKERALRVIDWFVNTWDFNDRALILPFTLESSGGLLPEKFDYVLTVTARGGEQDVQRGSVDLSQEIVPDLNSFGVEPGGRVDVSFTGPRGSSLWLLQNNVPAGQSALSLFLPRRQ